MTTPPPGLDRATVKGVLAEYFGSAATEFELLPLSHGFSGTVARLSVVGKDLLIKRFSAHLPRERIDFGLQLQNHLSERGIPTPKPYRTHDQQLSTTDGAGIYSLYDFIAGRVIDPDVEEAQSLRHSIGLMGKLLGRAHMAALGEQCFDFPLSPLRVDTTGLLQEVFRLSKTLKWSRGGRVAQRAWIVLHEAPATSAMLRDALSLVDAAIHLLVESKILSDPRMSVSLPVHSDVHFQNVLFESGRISALVDFDNSVVSPQLYDVGSTMAAIWGDPLHYSDFLETYFQEVGEAGYDSRLVCDCMLLRLAKSLLLQISKYTNRTNQRPQTALSFIRRLVRLGHHLIGSA